MTPPYSAQHHSSLLFPSASTSLSTTLTSLKRSNLSITNRLNSIVQDAEFVQRVSEAYGLPLIANERCGSWYIPPDSKAGSAYFKSTDGHHGQWSLSLRRLNLDVLKVIGTHGGCVIVDSTRRGKIMPDALSKTVPIWICAMNRLLFPDIVSAQPLHTPNDVVSESEHAQIEERLSAFVEGLRGLALDHDALREQLQGKPMRPVWVTPEDGMSLAVPSSGTEFHKVVLCTASSRVSTGGGRSHYNYVQGAADDSESWACGLDAPTFWRHRDEMLGTSEDELPALIGKVMKQRDTLTPVRQPVQIKPTPFWIGDNNAVDLAAPQDWDLVISCGPNINEKLRLRLKQRYIHLECGSGKIGSRDLRTQLPKLEALAPIPSSNTKILLTCPTGKDLAVGVALAMICSYCRGEDGSLRDGGDAYIRPVPSKVEIKQRLSWIMVAMPDAGPSRATLQSVNAFLMG